MAVADGQTDVHGMGADAPTDGAKANESELMNRSVPHLALDLLLVIRQQDGVLLQACHLSTQGKHLLLDPARA